MAEFPDGGRGGRGGRARPGQGPRGGDPRVGLDRRCARAAGPRHRFGDHQCAPPARARRFASPLPARNGGLLHAFWLSASPAGRVSALLPSPAPHHQCARAVVRDADRGDATRGDGVAVSPMPLYLLAILAVPAAVILVPSPRLAWPWLIALGIVSVLVALQVLVGRVAIGPTPQRLISRHEAHNAGE